MTYNLNPISKNFLTEKSAYIGPYAPSYYGLPNPSGNTTQNNSGSVLGTNTYSGGNVVSGDSGQNNNVPQESIPSAPSFDEYDAAIQQGMAALDQYGATLQPEYENTINEYETGATNQKTQARSEQTRRLNALGENRTEANQNTESAISAARRQASQLMQGIQSLYGGTTGTGAFKSEILGSQAMQNISGNQQALQGTLGKIYQAEEGVRSQVTNLLNTIDEQLTINKEKARNELQQALAQIASQKSELASSRAQMRMQALQNYQNLVADINARNTAFKQQLYLKAQQAQQQIDNFKNSTMQKFDPNLQAANFNVGETPYAAVPNNSGSGYTYLKGSTTKTNDEDSDLYDLAGLVK